MTAWESIKTSARQPGREFFDRLDDPGRIQELLLNDILKNNANSKIGTLRGFDQIASINGFQENNPIMSYEDFKEDINQILAGAQNILTQEPIILFEETGGSSGGSKLIPMTASGLSAIQNAVIPWLHNLLLDRPGITAGSAYWSISPATRSTRLEKAGIAIGLSSDAAYFGSGFEQDILATLAVPPEVGAIENIHEWRRHTLTHLLSKKDLSFISVWSPTFLLDLVRAIPEILEGLMQSQTINSAPNSPHYPLPEMSTNRLREINSAVRGNSVDTKALWPMLDTISCWLDASSAQYRDELTARFPGVYLQGKGLLATEGVVSIPVDGQEGSVLAISSGFFEFIDDSGKVFLSHELAPGKSYRVVITTFSGLYRYDLGDQVLVTGFLNATPLIKFCGRSGLVSDLCGEKLTEAFVLKQLSHLSGSAILAPCSDPRPGYVIFLDSKDFNSCTAITLTNEIELGLCANPQYEYAIRIGQLEPLSYCRVEGLWNQYLEHQKASGKSIGDIKPPALSLDSTLFNRLYKIHATD